MLQAVRQDCFAVQMSSLEFGHVVWHLPKIAISVLPLSKLLRAMADEGCSQRPLSVGLLGAAAITIS